MLAYTAHRRTRRQLSPTALALIIGVHALALVAVAAAKMDIPVTDDKGPIQLIPIKPIKPPPPPERTPPKQEVKLQPPRQSQLDIPKPLINRPTAGPVVDLIPVPNDPAPIIGPIIETPVGPPVRVDPPKAIVRVSARPTTPADLLRPPYPDSKRRSEEEATLRLRLSIDERGRVTAVDPVGAADPSFLAAARSHLLRFWRYKPATEDGRPVATSLTITLRFEIEDD